MNKKTLYLTPEKKEVLLAALSSAAVQMDEDMGRIYRETAEHVKKTLEYGNKDRVQLTDVQKDVALYALNRYQGTSEEEKLVGMMIVQLIMTRKEFQAFAHA